MDEINSIFSSNKYVLFDIIGYRLPEIARLPEKYFCFARFRELAAPLGSPARMPMLAVSG